MVISCIIHVNHELISTSNIDPQKIPVTFSAHNYVITAEIAILHITIYNSFGQRLLYDMVYFRTSPVNIHTISMENNDIVVKTRYTTLKIYPFKSVLISDGLVWIREDIFLLFHVNYCLPLWFEIVNEPLFGEPLQIFMCNANLWGSPYGKSI
jgi:hypothetical protein